MDVLAPNSLPLDPDPPMAESASRPRLKRLVYGSVFVLAGAVALTSGPRSLLDHQAGAAPAFSFSSASFLAPDVFDPALGAEAVDVGAADPTEVDWRMLAGLDYRTGEMTEELQAVIGKEAKVPGFMVPLEDYLDEVSEFLLVPYVGACVHTPPPPPNQLVYVKMKGDERAKVEWWNPIWIEGILELETTENVYGQVSYIMEADEIRAYEY